MSSFLVVADANVLVPAALCDVLLRTASVGMYRLLWTDDILEEVHRTLIGDLGKTKVQADRHIAAMKAAFPEALVSQYASLIPTMTNDPKDRHVLAAAVAAGAQAIVTSNLCDFPRHALAPFAVEAQAPDEFLTHLLDLDPNLVKTILMRQADALRNPPKTVSDILIELAPFAPTLIAQIRLTFQLQ